MSKKGAQTPILVLLAAAVVFFCGFALAWTLRAPEARPASDPTTDPGIAQPADPDSEPNPSPDIVIDGDTAFDPVTGISVERGGTYASRDEVALYLHVFGDLPDNYITKTKARKQGWIPDEGNLWDVCPGMSIGGGGFQNIEGELPVDHDPDRTWRECDIGYEGGYRGAERLVYSDDGYILYTDDHYNTFTQLFPREEA